MRCIELGSVERSGKSTYNWKIPNFSRYKNISCIDLLVSPLFSTSNIGEGFKWQMKLGVDRATASSNRQFLTLHFECLSYEFRMATITAGVLKNNGTILEERTDEYEKCDITMTMYHIAEIEFLMKPANKILNNDVLTIQCKIKMGKIQPVVRHSLINVNSSDKNNVLSREISLRLEEFDDFESMLNDRNFSDVSISVEDKTIMACKLILKKRSPVFAAMFRADMKEHHKNVVIIKDIKYDIFMELLRFIYSGKVRQLETIAMDLLIAADKYQMENLKNLCEFELMKQLGVDDAVRILKLADKHSARKLKKRAIEYIVGNKIDIFDQAEFRDLDKDLMYEICQAMK